MRRYIIVDDDATNNLICKMIIKKFNPKAKVILFQNPEEALGSITNEEDPTNSILFLDINMPTMTGWEFLNQFSALKEKIRNKYSIYMLSSSYEESNDKLKNYPFLCGFYSKPLKIEYLREIDLKQDSYTKLTTH